MESKNVQPAALPLHRPRSPAGHRSLGLFQAHRVEREPSSARRSSARRWLTTAPTAGSSHGLDVLENRGTAADKTRVRFEVDAPNAEPWLGSDLYGATDPAWRRQLIAAGGGMAAARGWWVSSTPTKRRGWVSVEVDGMRVPLHGGAFGASVLDRLATQLAERLAA